MKKLLLILIILAFGVSVASADWEVTVSGWNMSPGPGLAYEQVLFDGVVVPGCDNIVPANQKACVHTFSTKTDQEIAIRSFDADGKSIDYIIGNVGTGPNPASGGTILIIWK